MAYDPAMIGTTIGSYMIKGELGRGGMGVVYRAEHLVMGRSAAIKLLRPELSNDDSIMQRFVNEARAATAIQHPSIVEVYDFGYAKDGSAYIIMECLEGESLKERIRRLGRLSEGQSLFIGRQIADILRAAHDKGIVHRDLKPANIFLSAPLSASESERIRLLDFGIAKITSAKNDNPLTRTGTMLGTPAYMAPEQCHGAKHVDHRADLYSLGCVLFCMLSGRPPFLGTGATIIGAHIHQPPPPLSVFAPWLPPQLERLVGQLLAKEPDQRFPMDAGALIAELDDYATSVMGIPALVSRESSPVREAAQASEDQRATLIASHPPMHAGSNPGIEAPIPAPEQLRLHSVQAGLETHDMPEARAGSVAGADSKNRPMTSPPSAYPHPSAMRSASTARAAPPALAAAAAPSINPAGASSTGTSPTGATTDAPAVLTAPRPARSSIFALLALALMLVGLTIVGLIVVPRLSSPTQEESPAVDKPVARSAHTATDEAVAPTPNASAAATPATASNPATPNPASTASPQKITITVNSEPSGAAVYRYLGDVRLGYTPYQHEMYPVDGELVLVLRQDGYRPESVAIAANASSERLVTLAREKSRPRRQARRNERTSPTQTRDTEPAEPSPGPRKSGRDERSKPASDDILNPFQK
ncbi:MAG: hypothetical protein Tsb0020_12640 [Haliangiales bacterium]